MIFLTGNTNVVIARSAILSDEAIYVLLWELTYLKVYR